MERHGGKDKSNVVRHQGDFGTAWNLWQAGFKNVIALYGTNGWTGDHEQLLRDNGTTEIYLCLDNDQSGRDAKQFPEGDAGKNR